MKCPICTTQLVSVDHEGVEIDSCPDGHGSWLDGGQLKRIVDTVIEPRSSDERERARADRTRPTDAEHAAGARACPSCSQPMITSEYDEWSGIVIDVCTPHGVWMDHNELERAEAWIEGSADITSTQRSTAEQQQAAARAELDAAQAAGARFGPFGFIARALALTQSDASLESLRADPDTPD